MSSTTPRLSGGASKTIGPAVRSMKLMKYTVSAFGVRKIEVESINSENIRISLSCTPTARNPWRIARIEASWKACRNASTPRTNVR
jgi:hypothetical protein